MNYFMACGLHVVPMIADSGVDIGLMRRDIERLDWRHIMLKETIVFAVKHMAKLAKARATKKGQMPCATHAQKFKKEES